MTVSLKDRTLIIDVDDVLLDTHRQYVVTLQDKFGPSERYLRLRDQWEVATVLTPEENDYLWSAEHGYRSERFHEQLRFKDDALMVVNQMIRQCSFAFVLSDCPVEVQEHRRLLIQQYLSSKAALYFTNHAAAKSDHDGMTKAQFVKKLAEVASEKVVVLEDSPFNIEEMLKLDEVETVIVFDFPYNAHIESDKIIRVTTWKEVQAHIGG